jgi:hypothetical protein
VVVLPDYEPLTGPLQDNGGLVRAFPIVLADDSRDALTRLPETRLTWTTFSVLVGGENVSIPYRIYHNPGRIDRAHLSPLQNELLDCLLTRHHSGYVREEYLRSIIGYKHPWVPPFVLQLMGEYVVQILRAIRSSFETLDANLYRTFLEQNPQFFALTKQRVTSYWDCYYRTRRREDYVGFELVSLFEALLG